MLDTQVRMQWLSGRLQLGKEWLGPCGATPLHFVCLFPGRSRPLTSYVEGRHGCDDLFGFIPTHIPGRLALCSRYLQGHREAEHKGIEVTQPRLARSTPNTEPHNIRCL